MADQAWAMSAQGRPVKPEALLRGTNQAATEMNWDFPNPHLRQFTVEETELDWMRHLNNVIWLRWVEETAWAHSEALGFPWSRYEELGCAWVAHRHELDYLGAANLGDDLLFGTWVVENDGRLRTKRQLQVIRIADQQTLLRCHTRWVTVDLASGRPRRMSAEMKEAFKPVSQS